MNYQKHYDILIIRARTRVVEGYVERHHIIPRCMGGTNELSNIVELTPEEHYLTHLLLVKIYPDNHKLVFAANMMVKNPHGYRNNKIYGWLRKKFVESIKESKKNLSDEARANISKAHKGKIFTVEHRRKLSESAKGRIVSDEVRQQNSLRHRGKIVSEETREKLREANLASSPCKKKVMCIETGQIFISLGAAAKYVEGNKTNISRVAHGIWKSAYGFTWRFI